MSSLPPLILHVLPVDIARGAQTYQRELRTRLDGHDATHRTLTLFRSDGTTLGADHALGVPSGLPRRLGADPRAVWRLRRAYRQLRPAVVVVHGGEPLKYAVFAGIPRARIAYYKIGIGSAQLRGARRALYRALLRHAGAVAAVSGDVAREAETLGVERARLHVIPNGRDITRYDAPPRAPRDTVRIAFVGRLAPSKRPERFIELVRALRARDVDVEGVVAGGGPLYDATKAAAAGLPIDVVGEVDDVPAVLAGSDVFVFTSVPEGEGMPGVLIEAGLASLPVVTTDVPGVSDVIEHGATGIVVGVDDTEALVAATARLATDAAERLRMGAAARRRCEERFGIDHSVGQWQALLDRLVSACTSST